MTFRTSNFVWSLCWWKVWTLVTGAFSSVLVTVIVEATRAGRVRCNQNELQNRCRLSCRRRNTWIIMTYLSSIVVKNTTSCRSYREHYNINFLGHLGRAKCVVLITSFTWHIWAVTPTASPLIKREEKSCTRWAITRKSVLVPLEFKGGCPYLVAGILVLCFPYRRKWNALWNKSLPEDWALWVTPKRLFSVSVHISLWNRMKYFVKLQTNPSFEDFAPGFVPSGTAEYFQWERCPIGVPVMLPKVYYSKALLCGLPRGCKCTCVSI